MKMECDYVYGWIQKKKSKNVTGKKLTKMVNPRHIAVNTEEEEPWPIHTNDLKNLSRCLLCQVLALWGPWWVDLVSELTLPGAGSMGSMVGGSGVSTVTVIGAGSMGSMVGGSGVSTITVIGAGSMGSMVGGSGVSTVTVIGAGSMGSMVGGSGVSTVTVIGAGSMRSMVGGSGVSTITVIGAGSMGSMVGGSGVTTLQSCQMESLIGCFSSCMAACQTVNTDLFLWQVSFDAEVIP